MRFRTTMLINAAAAVSLVVAGCGSDEPDDIAVTGIEQTTTTTTEAPASGSEGEGESDTGDGADTGTGTGATSSTTAPEGGEQTVSDQIVLSDVQVGREGDVERVVFEFEGPQAPQVEDRWVEPPVLSAGEGAEVEVAGERILELAMSPASSARIDGEDVEQVFEGERVEGAGGVVQEAVKFGDFESRLEWAIGLAEEVPYEVSVLDSPIRVVVEFQTGG